MFSKLPRKTLAATSAALLAALGVGGAAIAQSNGSQPAKKHAAKVTQAAEKPGVESNAPENSAKDGDNVQYTAPGDAKSASKSARTSGAAAEAPGTEQAAGTETAGENPGSEVAGNGGPGGHADEPGNANADHQFNGTE